MLSDDTRDGFLHGIQQQLLRSTVDVKIYLDYSEIDERKFFPLSMVFPYPAEDFDENSAEGAYVLNQAITGFVKMIGEFVNDLYGTSDTVVAVGLHDSVELIEDPPYFEAVCGNLPEGYQAMAILIQVRFVSSDLRLVPYSFGLTRHKNDELEFLDHQLNKPTFNPEE